MTGPSANTKRIMVYKTDGIGIELQVNFVYSLMCVLKSSVKNEVLKYIS